MSKGVVIFAHNNRKVDYAKLSLPCAKLAKKFLKVPVSLVTDKSTVEWMNLSNIYSIAEDIYDRIIIKELDADIENYRTLSDGDTQEKIPFKNWNRESIWELTPYERTLLIDVDYLILSDRLNSFWEIDQDFIIADSIKDLVLPSRLKYHDTYISSTGINLFWATTIMFTKNNFTKKIFDLVTHIKSNYKRYAEIYRFDNRIYRNDFAFSLAIHMLSGFENDSQYRLPSLLTSLDKDTLLDVSTTGKLSFLIDKLDMSYLVASIDGLDMHVMNKQSIMRNYEKLMSIK